MINQRIIFEIKNNTPNQVPLFFLPSCNKHLLCIFVRYCDKIWGYINDKDEQAGAKYEVVI